MKKDISIHFGLMLLRVVPSALMMTHGIGKWNKLMEGKTEFLDPINIGQTPTLVLAVIAEMFCPLLIIIGLKTRFAAILVAVTMAVAAFVVHAGDPISKKELAILYMVFFLSIALLGPGKYSIDKR